MIPKEVLENVHKIEVTTSRLVTDVFAGQYHSVFKGRGIEFDEVREYQLGDDVRSIDWNVTARTGKAHIKKFIEERELTVMILVDASQSFHFATVNQFKNKLAAHIGAIIAFSAIKNNDKIGLIIFTDQIEKFIPPRKGKSHVLRMIREVLFFEPQRSETDLIHALEYLSKVTTRKSVAFVLSDFIEPEGQEAKRMDLKRALAMANRRHDVIGISLTDPIEKKLPNVGLLEIQDAETGEQRMLDTSSFQVRKDYVRRAEARFLKRKHLFEALNIDHVDISTNGDYIDQLVRFFKERQRRRL